MPDLHRSLIELAGAMNRPENDAAMLAAAGLTLERALFPLLVLIDRLGPIGVVDLAGRVGRDYTTVSRQLARLEELGLVVRQADTADRRVRQAAITPIGKATNDLIDAARVRAAQAIFRDWSTEEFDNLVRLMRKLADGMGAIGE